MRDRIKLTQRGSIKPTDRKEETSNRLHVINIPASSSFSFTGKNVEVNQLGEKTKDEAEEVKN